MAVSTVRPNGQGTRGSWVTQAGGTASLHLSIDDYLGGGAHDSDTTYVVGPNNITNNSLFVLLEDTPADFDPANITSVEIRYTHRKESAGVSNGADVIDIGYQLFRSDETTAITTELLKTGVGTTYTQATEALTRTGTHVKTDWDGARLRIRQVYAASGMADTTTRARVTAAEIIITYTIPPPIVTTDAPSNITPAGASSGGNVTSDSGATVTARGVRAKTYNYKDFGIASGGDVGSSSRTTQQVQDELNDCKRLGMVFFRADAPWQVIETPAQGNRDWTWPDNWIPYCKSIGLIPVPTVSYSPTWVDANSRVGPSTLAQRQAYAATCADLVTRYDLEFIELWNEPNHTGFWTVPDAASLTALYVEAYAAIKAVKPSCIVIGGNLAYPPAGSGIYPKTFLDSLIAAGFLNYVDKFSVHPYIANNQDIYWDNLDGAEWKGPDGSGSWFGAAPSFLATLQAAAPSMKVWFTETGDTALSTTDPAVVNKIIDRLRIYQANGWGEAIFWYAYRSIDSYSLTASDYSKRPAYHVFEAKVGTEFSEDATQFAAGAGGTGAFSVSLSGLTANTRYVTRAYAVNANGTGYGDTEIFKTGVLYSDSGTGIVSIVASGTDTYTPGGGGGTQHTDSGTALVSIVASGADVHAKHYVDSGTAIVGIEASGTDVHAKHYVDTGTGLVSIVASGTDVIERVYPDSGTGLVSIEASATQAVVGVDQGTPLVSIVPSAVDTAQAVDSATAIVSIEPSGSEVYTPAGGGLSDVGLLVRYYLDSQGSGTPSGDVADQSGIGTAFNLPVTLSGSQLVYAEPAANKRALHMVDMSGTARANKPVVSGDKLHNHFGSGCTVATMEIVFEATGHQTLGGRVFGFNAGSNNGKFTLLHGHNGGTSDGTIMLIRINDISVGTFSFTQGTRRVVHVVYDANGATNADKLKAYVDGSPVTITFGQNVPTPIGVGTEDLVMLNRPEGGRPQQGRLHYAALYSTAFAAQRVTDHYNILTNNDDAPTGAAQYTDSGTAILSIVASAVEYAEVKDSATATVSIVASALEERAQYDVGTAIVSIEAISQEKAAYSDAATAIVSIVASGNESLSGQTTDSGTALVQVISSSTDTEHVTDTAQSVVSIVASGTDVYTTAGTDAATAVVSIVPSSLDTYQYSDVGQPIVSIVASAVETYHRTDANQAILSIVASGTETLSSGFVDSGTAQVSIVPSATQTSQFRDSATAIVSITPSGIELYQPPAIISIVASATFAEEFTGLGLTGAGFYRRWTASLSRTRLAGADSVRFAAKLVSRWEASAYKRYVGKEG